MKMYYNSMASHEREEKGSQREPKGAKREPKGSQKGARMKKAFPKARFAEQEHTIVKTYAKRMTMYAKMEPTPIPKVINNQ